MKTAIEAYELPKLIPTTGGKEDVGVDDGGRDGVLARPFCAGVEDIVKEAE